MKEKKISEYFGKYINVLEVCDGSFHVKSPPKKFFNPVSPNFLIFGKSVAWHVCMKPAKPFEPIQNGFGDIPC